MTKVINVKSNWQPFSTIQTVCNVIDVVTWSDKLLIGNYNYEYFKPFSLHFNIAVGGFTVATNVCIVTSVGEVAWENFFDF